MEIHQAELQPMGEYIKRLAEPKIKVSPAECKMLIFVIESFLETPETVLYGRDMPIQALAIFVAKELRRLKVLFQKASEYNKSINLPATFETAFSLGRAMAVFGTTGIGLDTLSMTLDQISVNAIKQSVNNSNYLS